jgi:hypothetical protein
MKLTQNAPQKMELQFSDLGSLCFLSKLRVRLHRSFSAHKAEKYTFSTSLQTNTNTFNLHYRSMSFQTVTNTNNHGCHQLERGDFANAFTSFRTALQEIKVALGPTTSQVGDPMADASPGILPLPKSIKYPGLQPAVEASEVTSPQVFLHAHPIRMLDNYAFSSCTDENNRIHSAISVFNLALTLHLQAIETQSEKGFLQVQTLYDRTYQLLSNTIRRYNDGATGNAVVDLLVMAVFNNMGLVHLEFSCETLASGFIFQTLHRYASSVVWHGEQCSMYNDWFGNGQVQNFLLNGTVLGLASTTSAAAA